MDSQKHGKSRVRLIEEETRVMLAEEDAHVRLLNELKAQVHELKETVSEKKQMKVF